MLRRLLAFYWRESCNVRTLAFLLVVVLLTLFSQSIVWYDDDGEAKLYEPLSISIVDLDESVISFVMRSQLQDLEAIGTIYQEDLEQARVRLARNEILMILVIPEHFYEQTISGQKRDSVQVYLNEQMPAESNLFARLLNHAVDSFTSVQATLYTYQEELRPLLPDDEQYRKYSDAATLDVAFRMIRRDSLVKLEEEVRMRQFWFVVASLTSLFAMLPALLVLMLVQQERLSGRHERLLVANVPWWKLHLAKVLIGFMWLMTGLLPLLFFVQQFLPQLRWQTLALAVIPLYFSTALLSLALAYRSRQTEATMLTAWLLILAFLLVGGGIYPRQLLPGWMLWTQPLSPAYWSFTQLYDGLYSRPFEPVLMIGSLATVVVSTAASYISWRWSK